MIFGIPARCILASYLNCKSRALKQRALIAEDTRTLKDLLDELNALVGLDTVKAKVNDLIVYQKVQKLRRENNLHFSKIYTMI